MLGRALVKPCTINATLGQELGRDARMSPQPPTTAMPQHLPARSNQKMKSKTLTDIVRCYVAKLPLNEPGIYYDVVAADLANACAAAYEAGRTPGAQPLSQGSLARLRREAVAALENCPK